MKIMPYVLVIIFGWCLALTAAAEVSQKKFCTQAEAIQAETEASPLKNWDAVYRSFRQFAHCDDGAIGEGYSDAVGRLLAKDWSNFERLIALTSSDKRFEFFVIRHIDETVPADELNQIIKNTQSRCPVKARRLCARLRDAAR